MLGLHSKCPLYLFQLERSHRKTSLGNYIPQLSCSGLKNWCTMSSETEVGKGCWVPQKATSWPKCGNIWLVKHKFKGQRTKMLDLMLSQKIRHKTNCLSCMLVHTCVSICSQVCTCMWRPEASLKYHFSDVTHLSFLFLFFEKGFFLAWSSDK